MVRSAATTNMFAGGWGGQECRDPGLQPRLWCARPAGRRETTTHHTPPPSPPAAPLTPSPHPPVIPHWGPMRPEESPGCQTVGQPQLSGRPGPEMYVYIYFAHIILILLTQLSNKSPLAPGYWSHSSQNIGFQGSSRTKKYTHLKLEYRLLGEMLYISLMGLVIKE